MYVANFVVTVDSTDTKNSSAVCGSVIVSDVSIIYPSDRLFVSCAQPLVGRYVTITRLNTSPQPGSLVMAEVQVSGIVLSGNKHTAFGQQLNFTCIRVYLCMYSLTAINNVYTSCIKLETFSPTLNFVYADLLTGHMRFTTWHI